MALRRWSFLRLFSLVSTMRPLRLRSATAAPVLIDSLK
jgi:hypothetical protein